MCSHIPNLGEQMVYYHGYYIIVVSPVESVKKEDQDGSIPCIIEDDCSSPTKKAGAFLTPALKNRNYIELMEYLIVLHSVE